MDSEVRRAAVVRAPHGTGTSDTAKCSIVTITSTASAGQDTGITAGAEPWEYITLISSTAVHIRFGSSSTITAIATDCLVPASTYVEFAIHPADDRYFSAIRDSADGTLFWWRSS